MSIRVRALSNPLIAFLLILLLLNPVTAVSAGSQAAPPAPAVLKPSGIISTQGSTVGSVTSLYTQDQSGTVDTPSKYVLFQTPGKAYKGYRTYIVPAGISPGTVSGIAVKANYKGPVKASQSWTWYLYDWVHSTWVKVGDNTGTTLNVWKVLQFNATGDVRRFVNNTTRQIRLQLVSSNALYDAKLDYEAITVTYGAICSDPLGCVLVQSGQPIHIAYLLNMPGLEAKNGAIVAAEQAGTILGHAIQLDGFSRANCDNTVAQADMNKLLTDASILAVLGTTCSGEAMTVMPAVSGAGFSMVSPSNTIPGLTDPGTPGYLRVSWSDSMQGEAAAEYALSLGLTKAATIHDGTSTSMAQVQAFISTFTTGAGTITSQNSINPSDMDFMTLLAGIGANAPEMVFFPTWMPAGGYLINQARVTTGLTSAYLISADSMRDPWVMLATGTDLQGFLVTGGADSSQFSTGYPAFVTAYTTRFGSAPSDNQFAPYGYDAFNLVQTAIETAASPAGTGAHLIGRQALRTALYGTSGLAGLTGTLTCQPEGDCAETPALAVYEYTAGVSDPTRIWP